MAILKANILAEECLSRATDSRTLQPPHASVRRRRWEDREPREAERINFNWVAYSYHIVRSLLKYLHTAPPIKYSCTSVLPYSVPSYSNLLMC